jgi:2-hydroxy-3-keto-5-methylthiopentenyl-1-phosphate phosphatase
MSQPIVIFDFDGTMIRRDSTLWLIRELLLVSWWKFPVVFAYLVGSSGNLVRDFEAEE